MRHPLRLRASSRIGSTDSWRGGALAYLALGEAWGVRLSTLGIVWTLAKAPHIVPIPGTRTASHLEECAEAEKST